MDVSDYLPLRTWKPFISAMRTVADISISAVRVFIGIFLFVFTFIITSGMSLVTERMGGFHDALSRPRR